MTGVELDGAQPGRQVGLEAMRSALPTPDSTDQLCAMESIWHSTLSRLPSGVPSSK